MIRNPYNYDPNHVSQETAAFCVSSDPSLAKQEFRDEVDINQLVSLFLRTGIPQAPIPPSFVEFSETFDFQTAMAGIVKAREAFAAMPSSIRDRFNHDPSRLMTFLSDSENRSEAVKLGLVLLPPDPPPASAPAPSPQPPTPVPETGAH